MLKTVFLVEQTSRPLIEFGLDVGFESSAYLCRAFRNNLVWPDLVEG